MQLNFNAVKGIFISCWKNPEISSVNLNDAISTALQEAGYLPINKKIPVKVCRNLFEQIGAIDGVDYNNYRTRPRGARADGFTFVFDNPVEIEDNPEYVNYGGPGDVPEDDDDKPMKENFFGATPVRAEVNAWD